MIVAYMRLTESEQAILAGRPAAAAPAAYRVRLAQMASTEARAQTLAGLWLLDRALSLAGAAPGRLAGIDVDADGRPVLPDGPCFSISHSARLVACALAEGNATLGLDVEIRRARISTRLQQRIAPTGDFFRAWCAREATVKASGRVGLARIQSVAIVDHVARLDGRDWYLTWPALGADYVACLALDRPITPEALDVIDYSGELLVEGDFCPGE